jgi:signal transduction histidine kinase
VRRPRLKLRGALLVGTLIPLLLVAVVSIVVTTAMTTSLEYADALQRSTRILYRAGIVTKDILDAETAMRGFVITGQESFLDPYNRAIAAFPTDTDTLKAIVTTDPPQAARLQAAIDGFAAWQAEIAAPVIAAARAGDIAGADALVSQGEGKTRMDDIRADLDALTAAEQSTAATRTASQRDFNTNVRRISFYGTLLALVLGVIIAIVFARRVSRRVRSVSTAANAIAGGDLAQRVTVQGHDEVADLATSFNAMAARLESAAAAEQAVNDELRRRTSEAELANRELESFSYSVSHDLRAPLRSMDGFSQALAEDYADRLDDTAKDYITRIRASSVRMAQLIDDLLQLSRITRDPVRKEAVDVSAIAAAVVAELRATDPERTVDVSIQSGMHGFGEPRLVRIALVNLIGNAWKFTRERPDAHIDVRMEQGADGPEFVVADNGAGFDMRYAANLFGPFQRMHPAERFAGTGVGLATVQRIVHRHGGTIRAESAVGEGARFRFTLGPDATTAEPRTAAGPPGDAAGSTGARNVAPAVSAVQGGASGGT